jgi:hypothetical protein
MRKLDRGRWFCCIELIGSYSVTAALVFTAHDRSLIDELLLSKLHAKILQLSLRMYNNNVLKIVCIYPLSNIYNTSLTRALS